MDGVLDLERIAEVIQASGTEIAVLQEVDQGTIRSFGVHQADSLGLLLNMTSRFGPSIDFDGGKYGNALLSKYPIIQFSVHALETEHGFEDRTVFHAVLLLGKDTLTLLGTHLGLDSLARVDQVNGILELIPQTSNLILAGDFNFEPGSVPYRMLNREFRDAQLELDSQTTLTFPAYEPDRRIDYIFIGSGIGIETFTSWKSSLTTLASDHLPQVLKFNLK